MTEEPQEKEISEIIPESKKKYIMVWRNKWITAKAGDIDDFINTYEELANLMKRWKSEGITLDDDIIGGVDDDYAQFCTYDEAVALREGFEEEELEEEFQEEYESGVDAIVDETFREWEQPKPLEFKINQYLSLKLNEDRIQIYVNEKRFDQCRYLLIINPQNNQHQDEINSIDEVESLYQDDLEENITPKELGITKEQEFWAHCSNLQAWAENNYNSRLLHRNLAFPLLKKLTEVGDKKASRAFKDEIAQRFSSGYIPVMRFLFAEKYMDFLTREEFSTVLDDIDFSKFELNSLMSKINDYLKSNYGKQFLLRIKHEFKEFLDNNRIYVEIKTHKVDKSEVSPIAITPDNKFFIRGSNDGKLKVFNILTGELVRVFGDHDNYLFQVAISPRGKYVASSTDTDIKIWDFKTGKLVCILKSHRDTITSLVFAPDNDEYLVSGSSSWELNECAIKFWNLVDHKLINTKDSHWEEIASLAFSRDGKYLVSSSFDKTVNIWEIETRKLLHVIVGHKKGVRDVAITDGNRHVVSASYDDMIRIWDFSSGVLLREFSVDKSKFGLHSFVLTPDSKFIIVGLQGEYLENGGLLKIFRLSDGMHVQTLPIKQNFSGYYEELNNLAISDDGRYIISASRERMVKVWMVFTNYIEDLGDL